MSAREQRPLRPPQLLALLGYEIAQYARVPAMWEALVPLSEAYLNVARAMTEMRK